MWFLSPSGWPTWADDNSDHELDLAERGYEPIDAADVQAAIDAYQAGAPAAPQDVVTVAELEDPASPASVRLRAALVPRSEFTDLVTKRVVRLGVFTDSDEPDTPAEFTAIAGETPTVVLHFASHATPLATTLARATADHAAGVATVIGWMPQDGTNDVTQPLYQLADIIAGNHDAHMTAFLTGIRDLGFDVYIRWAHEMNGDWYPWGSGVNGNSAGQFVQAWRHVHDLATSLDVDNISWMWAVNAKYPGSTPIAGLYPGDEYVDVVAVHGYNADDSALGWRPPHELFDATISEIVDLAPDKPLWISEMGTAAVDQTAKAGWVAEFFEWLVDSRVSAFIYFDTYKAEVPGENDWRLYPDTEPAAAFTAGMAHLREWTRPDGADAPAHLAGATELLRLSQRVDRSPGDSASMWSAGGAETLSRIGLTDITGTSGRLSLTYFTAPKTTPITNVAIAVGANASAGATVARVAIFEVADSGDLTKIGQTANDPTFGATTFTHHERQLSNTGGFHRPVTLVGGRRYAFGWLNVATTAARLKGQTCDAPGYAPIVNRHINAQADIADSYTSAQLTNSFQPLFIAGIYY